jgi:hypothetical protein
MSAEYQNEVLDHLGLVAGMYDELGIGEMLGELTLIGAQIASTWEQVQAIDSAEPIDALIIDASAQDMVERDWLADAYRRGVVVAAFNLYAPDLADLVADPCVAADGFASDPYPGDFFVVSYCAHVGYQGSTKFKWLG